MSYVPLPTVYEREGRTERAWDIYSRLLRDRIIFIGTPINDFVANAVIAQMLFLQMEDAKRTLVYTSIHPVVVLQMVWLFTIQCSF